MALLQYTVSMTGSKVQATTSGSTTPNHQPVKYVRVENEASNANVQYGNSNVTTTNYAGTVIANTTTINNGVVIFSSGGGEYAMNLDEFWFTQEVTNVLP